MADVPRNAPLVVTQPKGVGSTPGTGSFVMQRDACPNSPLCGPSSHVGAVRRLGGPRCCQLVNRSTSPLGRSPIPWAETAYPPASASPYCAPARERSSQSARAAVPSAAAYAVAVMRLVSARTGNLCSHARRSWAGSHSSAYSRRRTLSYRSWGVAASIRTTRYRSTTLPGASRS